MSTIDFVRKPAAPAASASCGLNVALAAMMLSLLLLLSELRRPSHLPSVVRLIRPPVLGTLTKTNVDKAQEEDVSHSEN